MATRGLFITLADKPTLKLYLEQGIFSQHMSPEEGVPETYHHYRALADYGSARQDAHVFFFREGKIYYGGQVEGSEDHGAFYLNGQRSPLGREADADLVWDESTRDDYERVAPGLFTTEDDDDDPEEDAMCQPFLLQFEDNRDLKGTWVTSNDLYFELGEYPYPLPTNALMNQTFCTMTPAETKTLLELLEENPRGREEAESEIEVELEGKPVPYHPKYDIDQAEEAHMESHLEAAVISNPDLLPGGLQPDDETVCRQVPICPFKPEDLDRADVCYFHRDLKDGTVPDRIIELKVGGAGADAARQVRKYSRWIDQRHPEVADEVDLVVYAPRFKRTFDDEEYIGDYAERVIQWEFGEQSSNGNGSTDLSGFQ